MCEFVRRILFLFFFLVMRHIELYNGSEMSIDWKMFKGAIDILLEVKTQWIGLDRCGWVPVRGEGVY